MENKNVMRARPVSKTGVRRAQWATVIVSVAAFVASVGGIAATTRTVQSGAISPARPVVQQNQSPSAAAPATGNAGSLGNQRPSGGSLVRPTQPQFVPVRPLFRSRGS